MMRGVGYFWIIYLVLYEASQLPIYSMPGSYFNFLCETSASIRQTFQVLKPFKMHKNSMLQNPQAHPDMDYLDSEAAQSRCVIAAHAMRLCPHVVEIGGFTTPISLFLTGRHESVTVIDPLMRAYSSDKLNGYSCQVRHIPSPFQHASFDIEGEYGFVMLGASLKHFSEDPVLKEQEWAILVEMISGAQVSVIEAAIDWPLGKGALDKLLEIPNIRVRTSIDLNLSANPGMDPDHYRRRLLVLEPV